MGQLYDDFIRKFLRELGETSLLDPEKCRYPVYRLDSGALVGEPVQGTGVFYYLTGSKKGELCDRYGESLLPVNSEALAALCPHYDVNGVQPGVGPDGQRYVIEAEPENPFRLKPGDPIPSDWETRSIW